MSNFLKKYFLELTATTGRGEGGWAVEGKGEGLRRPGGTGAGGLALPPYPGSCLALLLQKVSTLHLHNVFNQV